MKPSGVITLLTDFGLDDAYVAMMKGVILTLNPNARLIDLSHRIRTGAVYQAAGLLLEALPFFPEGTVHLAVVDPGVGTDRRPIAVETRGHRFVGPDNGLFWPVIEASDRPVIVELTEERFFLPHVTSTFHGRDIFAPVAAHLSCGLDLKMMGPPLEDPVRLAMPEPRIRGEALLGQIVHVDHFGNLITNIDGKTLRGFLASDEARISSGRLVIRGISETYGDREEGSPLALLNSSGRLEIAVNLGRASECLGVDAEEIIGTAVRVEKD